MSQTNVPIEQLVDNWEKCFEAYFKVMMMQSATWFICQSGSIRNDE